jgi:hypothetical protein
MTNGMDQVHRDFAKINRQLGNMLPMYRQQITHYSCTDGNWSVTAFPDHHFPGGAGFYMHRTASTEAICPRDVQNIAGVEVVDELRALGRFIAWGH